MYFAYFEKGLGELCFESMVHPFALVYSERIPEVFWMGLS